MSDQPPTPANVEAPGAPNSTQQGKSAAAPTPVDKLPPYKVLLHNDDHTPMDHVVESILQLTPLNNQQAMVAMVTAHTRGCSLLLITHRERAELYQAQFATKLLTVTIEPA